MNNRTLDHSTTCMGDEAFLKICFQLDTKPEYRDYTSINVRDNNLTSKSLGRFWGMLNNTLITSVDISFNQVGESCDKLASCIKSEHSKIIFFNLSGVFSNCSKDNIEKVFNALNENKSIKEINLSYNNFKDDAAPFIIRLLITNKTIERMNLSKNAFNEDAITKIKFACKTHPSLRHLDLSFNADSSNDIVENKPGSLVEKIKAAHASSSSSSNSLEPSSSDVQYRFNART